MKTRKPITFNYITNKFENLSQEEINTWKEIYPAVQVENEIRKCEVWAIDTKRKNYRRSISKWLDNIQKNNTTAYIKKETPIEQINVSTDDIEFNQKVARHWEYQLQEKNIPHYAIYAKTDAVEFILPNGVSSVVSTHMPQQEFVRKCQTILKRMQII